MGSLLPLGCLAHAGAVVQQALAEAEVLGGALQQLIVGQELQALLQGHGPGGGETQGVVRAGGAHIGQLLLLAHVDGDVLRLGALAHDHAGIHAKSTGKIGFFKIISESSVAAGIRRIEALTGKACEEAIYGLQDTIVALKGLFNNAKDLEGVIRKYIDEHDALKKDVEKFQAQAVERAKDKLVENAKEINGVKVVTAVLPMEPAAAKDLVFKVREALPENMICVVGSVYNDKPMLSVMFSDDMVKDHGLNAGKMIREAAKLIQGGGGGQPHYAQAGGKNKDGLSAAVDKVVELAQL